MAIRHEGNPEEYKVEEDVLLKIPPITRSAQSQAGTMCSHKAEETSLSSLRQSRSTPKRCRQSLSSWCAHILLQISQWTLKAFGPLRCHLLLETLFFN